MAQKSFNPAFNWGDVVYLKTDPGGFPYIVVAYELPPRGIVYVLQHNIDPPIEAYLEQICTDKESIIPPSSEPEKTDEEDDE